jgi:hypothetical protein
VISDFGRQPTVLSLSTITYSSTPRSEDRSTTWPPCVSECVFWRTTFFSSFTSPQSTVFLVSRNSHVPPEPRLLVVDQRSDWQQGWRGPFPRVRHIHRADPIQDISFHRLRSMRSLVEELSRRVPCSLSINCHATSMPWPSLCEETVGLACVTTVVRDGALTSDDASWWSLSHVVRGVEMCSRPDWPTRPSSRAGVEETSKAVRVMGSSCRSCACPPSPLDRPLRSSRTSIVAICRASCSVSGRSFSEWTPVLVVFIASTLPLVGLSAATRALVPGTALASDHTQPSIARLPVPKKSCNVLHG